MIAVLNTRLANAASVLNAIGNLGYSAVLTQDPDQIAKSSRLILPGVGTAAALMNHIHSHELKECLTQINQPVLGICLGMQVLYQFSEEGNVDCLGIFEGSVKGIKPGLKLPVPHMGWNRVLDIRDSKLLKGIPNGSYFYFVHSFRVPDGPETSAIAEYGEDIPALVESSHWFGTQFHPERSGSLGERLLLNFLNL
jgi:glutamine amidotransferase